MAKRGRLLVVIGAVTLIAAACGDSGGTATSTSEPGGTTTLGGTSTSSPAVTATTVPVTTTTTTTTTLPPITVTTLPGVEGISVSTTGVGSIRVGMTVEEAEEASGLTLAGSADPQVSEDCYYVSIEGDDRYEGVLPMVYEGEIGRIDIIAPSAVTTRSGAGIGMPESDVRELFPGRIEDADDFTSDGHAIAYVPADEVDADYRVVFEIVDGVVGSYRAGILPAVGLQEGCL